MNITRSGKLLCVFNFSFCLTEAVGQDSNSYHKQRAKCAVAWRLQQVSLFVNVEE